MEVYSVEYWQENWDELMGRVENGETIGIENKETGERCVMVPADDELLRIYTEQNNEALDGLLPTPYNIEVNHTGR